MIPLPTDLQILEAVYGRYYHEFENFTIATPDRPTKAFIKVDLPAIATKLRVDVDIVFGRLYYHLQQKYGFRKEDGLLVPLFTRDLATPGDYVHFPLLSSVLATLRAEDLRQRRTWRLAIVAICVSIGGAFLSALVAVFK